MKTIIITLSLLSSLVIQAQSSFYKLKAETIEGDVYKFDQLKGKKVLIVNTASKCGFTPQYEGLEKLHQTYKDQGLVIIGFPANNFMKQEPGTNEEISSFCQINYGVSFQMMAKISVKGKDIHPVYQWLTQEELNRTKSSAIKWNFQKYLIDENGQLIEIFPSKTKPMSEELTSHLSPQ